MSRTELIRERIKILIQNAGLSEMVYIMLEDDEIKHEMIRQMQVERNSDYLEVLNANN